MSVAATTEVEHMNAKEMLRVIRTLIKAARDVEDVEALHKVHREVLNAVALGLGETDEPKRVTMWLR